MRLLAQAFAFTPAEMQPPAPTFQKQGKLAQVFATTRSTTQELELPTTAFPISFRILAQEQQKDKTLKKKVTDKIKGFSISSFHGGEKNRLLILKDGKIVVPKSLQHRIVDWYHTMLCHPGETRTEESIRQHFTWKGLKTEVQRQCKACHICQVTKKVHKNYGKLPPKEPEVTPWEYLCVDMIGPYKVVRKAKKPLELWCVTMIDPATSWFEIREVPGTKRADFVANIVEQAWLTRYPWPQKVTLDRGTEFMAEFSKMVQDDYGIKKKPITKRNPQANAIVERVHQTIGNMIRTFEVQDQEDLDESDPWSGILAAVSFAVRATFHTTTKATPMQLVFGRDAMLNIPFTANWKYIEDRKRKLIEYNNKRENSKRLNYTYESGDLVLIKQAQNHKFGKNPYKGPYRVVSARGANVTVDEGNTTDIYNLRQVKPYRN